MSFAKSVNTVGPIPVRTGFTPIPNGTGRGHMPSNLPVGTSMAKYGDEYQIGLFDCTHDLKNSVLACLCPTVLACQVANKLTENCCYPVFFGYLPLSTKFRTLAGIQESMCIEGCKYWCCHCCFIMRLFLSYYLLTFHVLKFRLANELSERSFNMERQ